MINIGYACLSLGVRDTGFKSCRRENATEANLERLVSHNLRSLQNLLHYNRAQGIGLFRITSDLIPFGSSSVNTLQWWEDFAPQFAQLGDLIKEGNMRVSMHPGQYTVLNSPHERVVENSIRDLTYHALVLDSLQVGLDSKIVLHIGGVYGNKEEAVKRFTENFARLNQNVKRRLVIENDGRFFTIEEVLAVGRRLGIPVVFDNLHHDLNRPQDSVLTDHDWIKACSETWDKGHGRQKIHYSQQDPAKKSGAHSQTIRVEEFLDFYQGLQAEVDIMLEVKDKNLSAVKCIYCTKSDLKINQLEKEWSKYKYTVLERSPEDYVEIRQLLKDKKSCPTVEFYRLIEHALKQEPTIGQEVNGMLHVWGYFNEKASIGEKNRFGKNVEAYKNGHGSLRAVKNQLKRLAEKYREEYLLNSYYFTL